MREDEFFFHIGASLGKRGSLKLKNFKTDTLY